MAEHKVISVFGEAIEIVVSSKSTNYQCCVGIQTSPPGGGPPPHMHEREEETFMVLEGEYEFFDNGKWVAFRRGETRCSLRGTMHAFRNSGSMPGKMMFITNAGGLDEYFAEISPLILPKDMDRLTEISKHFGYVFMAPNPPPSEAY